jgi:hypothetical protein
LKKRIGEYHKEDKMGDLKPIGDVKEIIVNSLIVGCFDGLYNSDLDCGCSIMDFAPCGNIQCSCRPADKTYCWECLEIDCPDRSDKNDNDGCFRDRKSIRRIK